MTSALLGASSRLVKREGPFAAVRAFGQVLRARWDLRHASDVGAVRLRGRANVVNRGRMSIEDYVRLDGTTVRLDLSCAKGASLRIGTGTYINYGSNIGASKSVDIGANCMIGQYAIIMDSDQHNPLDHSQPAKASPVVIDDNVWLGARVTVLRGAHIGHGSVIGAHSVVTGDIPPKSLAAGAPARVIRSL